MTTFIGILCIIGGIAVGVLFSIAWFLWYVQKDGGIWR